MSDEVHDRITALKSEAVRLKKSGDTKGALAKLQEAKSVEFSQLKLDDVSDPAKLKQMAVYFKQKGEMESAKRALLKAKTITADQSVKTKPSETSQAIGGQTRAAQNEHGLENPPQAKESSPEDNHSEEPKEPSESSVTENEKVQDEISAEDMNLLQKELYGAAETEDATESFDPNSVSFSEEELMDLDMMTEFKIGGLGVPSNDVYESKIAQCRQLALKHKKDGEKQKALGCLRKMKQLQVVLEGLAHVQDGLNLKDNDDDDMWLAELNQDDHALIRELFDSPSADNGETFTVNELAALDDDALRGAQELGLEVPSPEQVLSQAEEKRVLAIKLKRGGDLKGAQTALSEYKGLTQQAERLSALLGSPDGDGPPISEEALEGLLDEKKVTVVKATETRVQSAEELKAMAVRLRDAKQLKEATEVLKKYKVALQREAQEAEKVRCKEIASELATEISLANEQERLFVLYTGFVDASVGMEQQKLWMTYIRQCSKALELVKSKGSQSLTFDRKVGSMLHLQPGSISSVIHQGIDPREERLEVGIIGSTDLSSNKFAKSIDTSRPSKVRITVSIQLPRTEEDSGPIVLMFESSLQSSDNDSMRYSFDTTESKYVSLARGDSRLAKNVVKRMERRKVQIQIHHLYVQEPRSRGFFGRTSAEAEVEPTFVGKIVLELKDLLANSCIAGDFEIMANGGKLAGGRLGLCIRTGAPFVPDQPVVNGGKCEPFNAKTFRVADFEA